MIKIIIIDDSIMIGKRLSSMLNDIDGVVLAGQATCAREGLELVRATRPDFIVLDINLPDVSGLEIIAEIKNIDPEITIAMLTNYPYTAYRKRSMDLGADYFFDKSKEFGKLIETLTDLARNKDKRSSNDRNSEC
jgi:DNA-binding NarL/FixJ family response regulator